MLDFAPSSVRERLEEHRANAVCATCHSTIDPLGFALEHFDAIGRYREIYDTGQDIVTLDTIADPDLTFTDGADLVKQLINLP